RREGRYRFKHAVVQEVAYNTLLVRRRIELHKRVATAYEKVLGEGIKDFLPALAHHYLLGEVPDKAAEFSWKAAERATAIHAHVEALHLAEQALELYEKQDKADEAVRALYLIARVRRFRGENDAALSAYERALAIAEALGLLREVSLCLDAVGYAYGELGNFRESYAHNQRRLPIARSLQDSDELIDAHNMIANAALVLGDFNEVIEHASTARDLAIETEKPRLGGMSVHCEAVARLLSGDFAGTIVAAARREQFLPTGKVLSTLAVASAAAAALASPDEKSFRERLVEAEATPLELASCDFLTAFYGQRESESSYHAIRSAGWPRHFVDQALMGPLAVLAAARWGI